MNAVYVCKSEDICSMPGWTERDRAIQAKGEYQNKNVFSNQVTLEIRRVPTYKVEDFAMISQSKQ